MSVRKKIVMTKGEPVTYWIADYRDGYGTRHQRRFGTKKEATAFIEPIKVAVRAGTHVSLPSDLTVGDACDNWIREVEAKGSEYSTLKFYREHIKLHILPRIGTAKLAKLNVNHIKQFRDSLLGGDDALSRPTASKVLTSFKSMLRVNGCAHLGDGVTIKIAERHKEKIEPKDIPTPQEVARLVKKAKGKVRVLLMTAASTGLRASELRGLRWSDVDLKASELHVRQRADSWLKIGSVKTKGSRRTVPLGHALLVELKEWKLACPKCELDLVFPTKTGAIQHHKNMLDDLGRIMKAAGVVTKDGKPKYALHAFRHFFASWCINRMTDGGRELPPKDVQTLLGHSSIVMTMDRYGHLFPSRRDQEELDRSERALFG
jgi:integrase